MDAASMRLQVLCGDFSNFEVKSWKAPSSRISIFLSSTFYDTSVERNMMKDEIMLELRDIYSLRLEVSYVV